MHGKHRGVSNRLRVVWIPDETLSQFFDAVFDISSEIIKNSWRNSKQKNSLNSNPVEMDNVTFYL